MDRDPSDNRRPGRWRPINARRIGGHHNSPGWTDTGSGPGYEDPNRLSPPDTIPLGVQADTLRMMLARHQPGDDHTCRCGQRLGEEIGLCWYGRQAQQRLYEVLLDQQAADEPP
ncbi:hypothetical protein O7627_03140 [Solwaraspora sp. WMMD1047]|uniref:hypothetical protein n=1 Tax=Solwaraspora sp. WMMD1047 TaxID=3016102 RepID=UPI002416E95E|nr:hypothetical protein [Solwaraspora sp. WMMD1047]MDG4828300.1 hypothetical protein [Solwaraspora sp. WMMD1047]